MYFLLIVNLMTTVLIAGQIYLYQKNIKLRNDWVKSNDELIKLLKDFQAQEHHVEIHIQERAIDTSKTYN